MKDIELFYLSHCPYCKNAKKAIGELVAENPAYSAIGIKWIEESLEPELAASRDYYNVPAVFYEGKKLYEAKPSHSYNTIKEKLKEVFDRVTG